MANSTAQALALGGSRTASLLQDVRGRKVSAHSRAHSITHSRRISSPVTNTTAVCTSKSGIGSYTPVGTSNVVHDPRTKADFFAFDAIDGESVLTAPQSPVPVPLWPSPLESGLGIKRQRDWLCCVVGDLPGDGGGWFPGIRVVQRLHKGVRCRTRKAALGAGLLTVTAVPPEGH